ncbi:hypothetical protein AZF04_10720 [Alkalihalobacillus trypoxylicola]|uniref:Glycosyltransferase 2-like domain-containing protein n=2 Tax=Alkalihalobacillus trypoxylicola TaxID=519424 RepID=A0A161P8P3_9BACI|nr:hypothetical protein AZF04_10720 [Alkalihalobacillus trypoxylicola]
MEPINMSIIIPVYNAEKYLSDCIESLLAQSLASCEFLFINDGSTDRSREIIESYQKEDTRIQLFNQENQGVSEARNHGLLKAKGHYIGFVDSDDYVESDMFQRMYEEACYQNVDILFSPFEVEIEHQSTVVFYPFEKDRRLNKEYIKRVILPYFLKSDSLNSVCNKIYKRSLVNKRNIQFPTHIALGEDGHFNMAFFNTAKNAFYLDYCGYHYRDVKGSATRNIEKHNYFHQAILLYESKLPEGLESSIEPKEVKRLKKEKLARSVWSFIHFYFQRENVESWSKSYKRVKNMISHPIVIEAFSSFSTEHYSNFNRYEKVMFWLTKYKCVTGLYVLTAYSRMRNRKRRENHEHPNVRPS